MELIETKNKQILFLNFQFYFEFMCVLDILKFKKKKNYFLSVKLLRFRIMNFERLNLKFSKKHN